MFEKAIVHYKNKTLTSTPPPSQQLKYQSITQQKFFHVGYHADNVKSFGYQRKFKENILKPKYCCRLSNIKNKAGNETKLDRTVVAYSYPPYLGNLLLYKNLKSHICPTTYPLVIARRDLINRVRGLKTFIPCALRT